MYACRVLEFTTPSAAAHPSSCRSDGPLPGSLQHHGLGVDIYREAHTLREELAEAMLAGTRKDHLTELAAVPLLFIDHLA